MRKIRVGAVSYLNTKPLLFGMEHSDFLSDIDLVTHYPAILAEKLVADEIDLGLVPVSILPRLKDYKIVSDYCIGAIGPVASVAIFSDVPMDDIETVLLDYQSNTSVNLARVLLNRYWKKEVHFEKADEDFQKNIKGTTAGVVIGDRAFQQRQQSAYIYDLAEAWVDYTGVPFVFAAWVANKALPADFIIRFNEANRYGLDHLDEVIAEHPGTSYDLNTYYRNNISYLLDDAKRFGLQRFLEELSQLL